MAPLVVTLTKGEFVDKGPGRPIFTDEERIEMIDALKFVAYTALVPDRTAVPAIKALKPKIYVKGSETRRDGNMDLVREMTAVSVFGGETVFIDKKLPYSSGRLLSGELWKERRIG